MLLKISSKIKRLNKDFDKLNEEEFNSSLIEIKNEISKTLSK